MKLVYQNLHASARALIVLLWLAVPNQVFADAALGDGLKPDVRLLIDISGSMKDSDPENLRAPALDLIVRLLPEGSKAGVWSFGHDVKELVEHRVIDAAWRDAAVDAVSDIDNSGQLTNIPAAIEAATYDFDRLDPSYRTSIILLTDGKVDVSQSPMTNARAAGTLLSESAPNLGASGIPIHTIALSSEADWAFLRSLAKATGGIAEQAQSAEKLTEIFYQSLEMVAPTARVPIAGTHFQIDDSVREFTALIFFDDDKAALELIGPDGTRYGPDQVRPGWEWFRNRKFALVTVAQPQPGKWGLVAPGAGKTRVTVISDLRLDIDPLPNSLPVGKRAELGLRLRERGEILLDAEVLSLFDLLVEIEGPKGDVRVVDVMAEYPVPADGEYRVEIPGMEIPGRYKITARLLGETLERELPTYVEITGSANTSSISTLGNLQPEGDFRAPVLTFGAALIFIGLVVSALLARRRRRKLAVWKRRNLNASNGNSHPAVSGMRAPSKDRDTHS
ncbi:MAG: hypothetical protein ACJASY_000232 [Halioglobus sp.]|jgi:hypothetical protein